MSFAGQRWTPYEINLAQELRIAGKQFKEIACYLPNRTEKGLRRLFSANGWTKPKSWMPSRNGIGPVTSVKVDPALLADREKRANEPRTLTAILCGDPPFSQSALGGRNANKGLEEISALYKAQARLD